MVGVPVSGLISGWMTRLYSKDAFSESMEKKYSVEWRSTGKRTAVGSGLA